MGEEFGQGLGQVDGGAPQPDLDLRGRLQWALGAGFGPDVVLGEPGDPGQRLGVEQDEQSGDAVGDVQGVVGQ